MTRVLRWIVCAFLIVSAALASAASVVAIFVHTRVENTDAYVQTVAPLASDPAVQAAVADRLTDELTRRLDINELVSGALGTISGVVPGIPSQVTALAPVLTRQAESFISEVALNVVSSDQFAALWTTANRQAHAQFAAAVTGRDNGIVRADNTGTVSVSLEPVMTELRARLYDRGFTLVDRLPTIAPQFEILQSDELVQAQRWSNALDRAAAWLPWAAVICGATVVVIAPIRLRALSLVGLATALAMIALLAAMTVVRRVYLQGQEIVSPEAATAVFDTVLTSLVSSIRVLLAGGVAVAVLGYIGGGSRSATSMRNGIAQLVRRKSDAEVSTRREVPGPPR